MSRFVTLLCLMLVFVLAACESNSAETPTPQQPSATVDSAPVILPTKVEITSSNDAIDAADPSSYPIETAVEAAEITDAQLSEAYPVDAAEVAELPTPLPVATDVVTLSMDVAAAVDATVAATVVSETSEAVENDSFEAPVVPEQEQPNTVSSDLAGLVFKNALGLWQVAADGSVFLLTAPIDGADWSTTPLALSPSGERVALVIAGDLQLLTLADQTIERVVESSAEIECCHIEWLSETSWLFGSQLSAEIGPNNGHVTYFDSQTFSYDLLGQSASFGLPATAPTGELVAFDQAGRPTIVSLPSGDVVEIALDGIAKAWSAGWEPNGNRVAWLGTLAADPTQIGLAIVDIAAGTNSFISNYPPIATEWLPSRPAWQPDGEWIAYEAIPQQASDAGIWLVNTTDQTERFVGPGTNPRWNTDGSLLAFETINGIEVRTVETGDTGLTLLNGKIVGWTVSEVESDE